MVWKRFHWKELDAVDKTIFVLSALMKASIGVVIGLSIWQQEWITLFLASSILLLTFLPALLDKNFSLRLPIEFEFMANLFLYASLFLGELQSYYARFWWWDAVLHTGSGILLGLTGFIIVYTLHRGKRTHLEMSPFFVALFAFTFAMALGGLWEIFEFAMDSFFGLNMQKSGLVDTMWDLIVDALGALLVSILGYLYMKGSRGYIGRRLVRKFAERNPEAFDK